MNRLLSCLAIPLIAMSPAFASDATVPTTAVEPSSDAPRPVVSEIVRSQAAIARSWVGSVEAKREISLGFLVLGTLTQRSADLGDVVSKGDVLARLDATDLGAGVRAAEAGVAIAQARLETARDANDRAKELLQRGVTNQSTAEEAENNLAAAQAQLAQAHARQKQALEQRSYADLVAPADGVITAVHAETGATLDSGEAVFDLAAGDAREVIVSMTEDVANAMDIGTEFDIRLISNPVVTGKATLARIDPVSERTSRTRSAHLTLSEDSPRAFRLGTLVTARLAASNGQIMTVSEGALIHDADPPAVWVVSGPDRTLSRREIVTNIRAAGRVLVVAGLDDGDEVLVRGVNSVTEGQSVGPSTTPEAIR